MQFHETALLRFAPGEVWGYTRKSTNEEGAGKSLDDQADAIIETCETWGLPMSPDYIAREQPGLSGKLYWAGGGASGVEGDDSQDKRTRPVLTRLVEGIVAKRIRCIVCWSQDRLWRDVGLCSALIQLMTRHGCKIWDRNGPVDISTPEGVQAVQANANAAQYARERAAVDAPRGVRSARKKGKVVVNGNRLGFRSVGKATGMVTHIQSEQELVVEIFRLFVVGDPEHGPYSVYEIGGLLTERDIPWLTDVYERRTNVGETRTIIYATTLYSVLRDCRYQGRQKHAGQEWPAKAFLKADGEPVVPVWLYEAAQAKLDGNKQVRGTKKNSYGLTGLMRCALCGGGLIMNGTTVKDSQGVSQRVRAWVSKNRMIAGGTKCPHKLPMLHRTVVDEYIDTHLAPELIAELEDRDRDGDRLALTNEKATLKKQLDAAEKKKSEDLPLCLGKVSAELLQSMERVITAEISGLKQQIREIEHKMSGSNVTTAIRTLPSLPEPARRDVLRSVLKWVAVLPSDLPPCAQRYPDEKAAVVRPHPDRGRLIFLTQWGSLHTAYIHRGRKENGVYPVCQLRPATPEECVGTVNDLPDVAAFLDGLSRTFKCYRRAFDPTEMAPGWVQASCHDQSVMDDVPTFDV